MVTLDARTGKWLLAALIVSLGLNLFVGGLMLGHRLNRLPHGAFVSERHERAEEKRRIFSFIDRMASALPAGDREKFLAVIDGYRGELAQADKNFREARNKVRTAMSADNFDRAALENAFADVSARMMDVQKVLHAALTDAVSRLPPDARKRLADWEPKDKDKGWDKDRDKDRNKDPDKGR